MGWTRIGGPSGQAADTERHILAKEPLMDDRFQATVALGQ
jgi:hypothetical protein